MILTLGEFRRVTKDLSDEALIMHYTDPSKEFCNMMLDGVDVMVDKSGVVFLMPFFQATHQ